MTMKENDGESKVRRPKNVPSIARHGSYDDFMSVYDPDEWRAEDFKAGAQSILADALANRDIDARMAIANRLLDDGADAAAANGSTNLLHVYFGYRKHDCEREAPLLRRLLDGGADINLVSKRSGPPLVTFMDNRPFSETEAVPFYEEIFRRPDLDLSVWSGTQKHTLHDYILLKPPAFTLLQEFVHKYDRERGIVDGD